MNAQGSRAPSAQESLSPPVESTTAMTSKRSPVGDAVNVDAHQAAPPASIRAVLFDLDGTLYPKLGLRACMAAELALLPLTGRSVAGAREVWRQLRGFRRIREGLRALEDGEPDLARHQYAEAGRRLAVDPQALERLIEVWIHQRPLKYMRLVRRPGLAAMLERLRERGLRLGVFSDYPARDKLAAMGILAEIDLVLDAEDPAVSALKPHPKGLLEAARRWGLSPHEVLYVGDRPDIDGRAAERAGMPCTIIGGRLPHTGEHWRAVRNLGQIEAWMGLVSPDPVGQA